MAKKHPRQGVDLNAGVYRTDRKFLEVVKREFKIGWDLASSDDNCVVPGHFTVKDNALKQLWPRWTLHNWLNPPYDHIGPWAKKCYEESLCGAHTLFLVPASVGSNWFRDWVWGKAECRFLNGRLTFEGHTHAYPKDLLFAIYGPHQVPSSKVWNWREESKQN